MPFIRIHGIPKNTNQGSLERLTGSIQTAVSQVPVLNIKSSGVCVFYSSDLQEQGLGEEIVAMAEGVYEMPERGKPELDGLRNAVVECLEVFALQEVPQCTYVECFIASTVRKEDCASRDISAIRCPDCKGSGGSDSEHPCGHCHTTGRTKKSA